MKDKPTYLNVLFVWHFEDKTYDLLKDDPQKLTKASIIGQDKRLIVYGNLKGASTLYLNALINV